MSALAFNSCVELDLNPLSEPSSDNWYSTKEEIVMALNDLYRTAFFQFDNILDERDVADDVSRRNLTYSLNTGTLTSENGSIKTKWENYYKGIARALRIVSNLDAKGSELGLSEADVNQYKSEAYCYIGYAYGMIAFRWGQGILNKTGLSLDEAYNATLSPKKDLLDFAYECLDKAAAGLPKSYSGNQRFTKGVALAFKSRLALYNGDYAVSAAASKAIVELGVYQLHSNYGALFTAASSKENIFSFRGDVGLKEYYWYAKDPNNFIPRNHGGWGTRGISYTLACAYTCIDGLPIDKSPLYNPKNFFENRDPRLAMTAIPFATKAVLDKGDYNPKDYAFLGIEYTPNPYATTVMDFNTGKSITNNDSKAKAEHACYNGLAIKKFVDESWKENGRNGAPTTYPYIRYGEILLNYAEAAIETNTCTQDILDQTINALRDRAYAGTGIAAPHVSASLTQAQLRTVVRTERFVELALEGHRYDDLIRWKLAEKVFNTPTYQLPRVWAGSGWDGKYETAPDGYKKLLDNWDNGCYPIGGIPTIDENGIADISYMAEAGYIMEAGSRKFNPARDYLWPIPHSDIVVNGNLTQNPGY
ncbi:MAG: RagB/SusD family nutrient uptake outer membrane protein [Bacteroidales bacterium]|nr:RagB/SusD family nutrient uptake outer membrane protein [Candidatus Cryptobacteroides onthequi]